MGEGEGLKASHRATTSSKTPGKVNTGTVYTQGYRLRECEDCPSMTTDLVAPGKHAAHWVDGKLVNCIGKEIA